MLDRDEVEDALDEIRPSIQQDGGDVELIDVSEEGIVTIRLTGACAGCPMSTMTLKQGVEQTLKSELPEVEKVQTG